MYKKSSNILVQIVSGRVSKACLAFKAKLKVTSNAKLFKRGSFCVGELFNSQLQLTSPAPEARAALPTREKSHLQPPCETAAPGPREGERIGQEGKSDGDGEIPAAATLRYSSPGPGKGRGVGRKGNLMAMEKSQLHPPCETAAPGPGEEGRVGQEGKSDGKGSKQNEK